MRFQEPLLATSKLTYMGVLTCNACNTEFEDEADQKLHYRSEWHCFNLKRKVAGVPGVTEALFQARQAVLAEEENNQRKASMLYECSFCRKAYRSSKARAQHLRSRAHAIRASQKQGLGVQCQGITVIKPLYGQKQNSFCESPDSMLVENDDSEDDWAEHDPGEELLGEVTDSFMDVSMEDDSGHCSVPDADGGQEFDTKCCFMCDVRHSSIENCMIHMHKQHGFFIPDIEYLTDPMGLLTYLALKVKRDFLCLYCNSRCQPFASLEAVRKHMAAKSHCKVRYGDGDEDEDAELGEFYDYSSSYVDENGKQLVVADGTDNTIELGSNGCELVIRRKTEGGMTTKILGCREFLRYYRQRPRVSDERSRALAIALTSRYQNWGLSTGPSKERIVKLKILKEMSRSGVEQMRTRVGVKNNMIHNLPKNVPY